MNLATATGPVVAVATPQVSVIVPTWNERENISSLVEAIGRSLAHETFEVLVVDDASTDGTAEMVAQQALRHPNVRLVQRPGKMGLSSAVLDGGARSSGAIVVMMDADFSHDPSVLPRLVEAVHSGCDVAVGSRYVPGARIQGWPPHRRLGSLVFTQLARTLFRLRVHDPLSGFAAFRREVLQELPTRFSAHGFKLLLEILATRPSLRVSEVPITFADRTRGTSKLSTREIREFMGLCYRLIRWRAGQRMELRHKLPSV